MTDLAANYLAFAAYFAVAVGLTVIFGMLYVWTTPHKELRLVRAGNAAAALGFGGAMFGFALPLAFVIAVSRSLVEVALWGGVAMIVQIAAHFASRLFLPTLSADIEAGKFSAAIVQVAFALTLGLLQAACWTP